MDENNLLDYLAIVPDPRVERTRKHNLVDLLFLALCSVICGAEHWTHIEEYARAHEDWFRQFLSLPNGIPSHDTFGRVFAALDPEALERAINAFVRDLAGDTAGAHIALDGKTLRRSYDRASGRNAIQMVSAWVGELQVSFGQIKVDENSNEITALAPLLDLLNLRDATVTVDAMGCQADLARRIVQGGGHYVLALKGNQGALHRDVSEFFEDVFAGRLDAEVEIHTTVEKGHGRIEERTVYLSRDVDWLGEKDKWEGLRGLLAVRGQRAVEGKTTAECRYFITSAEQSARELGEVIRRHWGIENELHWTLDVAFNEDQCRVRIGNAAENLSRVRRIALAMLKRDKNAKVGVKGRRLKAAWDQNYLLKILGI